MLARSLCTVTLLGLACSSATADLPPAGPSFDCSKVKPDSIAALVCADAQLSALDRKLTAVYAVAAKQAAYEHPPMLRAEQRGWVKGRDDCGKSEDKAACVRESYTLRIAELQARYRLVPATGPVRYACNGKPSDEIVATFFQTDPPTLVAERGDQSSLMVLQPAASGAKYQGPNESFREHHGEARVVWGYGAKEMVCQTVK